LRPSPREAAAAPKKPLGGGRHWFYHAPGRSSRRPPIQTGADMEDFVAEELINILKKNSRSDHEQAFERAFELTRAYAGSANAQASAIPFVFEKLFELFVTGRTKS
jgi:hypothetical protein